MNGCDVDDPDEGDDVRSISRASVARFEHLGNDHKSGRGSSGDLGQPQHFQLHEPVVEYCLMAADAALECDEVAAEGKRQGEQGSQRAECPKRPRRLG